MNIWKDLHHCKEVKFVKYDVLSPPIRADMTYGGHRAYLFLNREESFSLYRMV